MKKTLLFALLALHIPMIVSAFETITENGITYDISYGASGYYATVIRSKNGAYCGSLSIPQYVRWSGMERRVEAIDESAFVNCTELTSISIPSSITSIPFGIFKFCLNLTSIVIDDNNPKYDCRNECNAIIETETNTLIAGCPNSIIPNGVSSIGHSAFYGCNGLTSIDIPNSVTVIGEHAFYDCSSLTSITIPSSVTSIGDYAFAGCSSLTSITIPDGVETIGKNAFHSSSSLTSIIIDKNNAHYDSRENCNAIVETSSNTLILGCKNTVIPNTVTSIGKAAFASCTGLTSITIPNSVTSISEQAFYDCSNLTSITCQALKVPYTGEACFTNVPLSSATLYVPASSIDAYKSSSNWKSFGTILPILLAGDANGNGVVEIGDVTSVLTLMATPEATGYDKKAADANGNGEIEIGDVTTILTIMANGGQ